MTTVRTLITRALGELLYIAEGETPTAGQSADGLFTVNNMVAAWRTESIMITFPASTNWRGVWETRTAYAVNDCVNVAGVLYTCTTAHTSSTSDRPIGSPDAATYWTVNTDTVLALDDQFPLPAQFERGVISLLALELASQYNVQPSALTVRKASEGKTAIMAAYMPITPVGVDAGLTRMPSQVWPYNVGTVS